MLLALTEQAVGREFTACLPEAECNEETRRVKIPINTRKIDNVRLIPDSKFRIQN